MSKIREHSLYLVISEEYGNGRGVLEIAEAAISGGVDIIQMREKHKSREELAELGGRLSRLCKKNNVTFIVNDDPIIAKKTDADGVHLGQEDIERWPAAVARDILGSDKIIGVSTHSICQFKIANESDIDYTAFGPIFPTETKDYFIGASQIKTVLEQARKPVFFIGGINLSNIDEILCQGARNIALIRGISEADDIAAATRRFKETIAHPAGVQWFDKGRT